MLLWRWRPGVLPLAAVAGVVIGISRIALGQHTIPEVMAGGVVGFFGAVGLLWAAWPVPGSVQAKWLAVIVCVVVIATHGAHSTAEAHASRLAIYLRGMICPGVSP